MQLASTQEHVPELARAYAKKLRCELGDEIVEVILFGSWARGEATEDSDIDVLVVIAPRQWHTYRQVCDLAGEFVIEYGVLIAPAVYDAKTWSVHVRQERPLARAVMTEGRKL